MSVVTDIILVTAVDDRTTCREEPSATKFNSAIAARVCVGLEQALQQVDGHAGGNKAVQCDVFMAAINYLDRDALLTEFRKMKWESPECVQLMLKGEHDDVFTIYTPAK